MKKPLLSLSFIVLWSGITAAGIDVQLNINVETPDIVVAETPAVVLVLPGIYVVPDYPEELFFVSGFYWVVRSGHWFRCSSKEGRWVRVEGRRVPGGLLKIPRGKYKNWHVQQKHQGGFVPSEGRGRGHDKRK